MGDEMARRPAAPWRSRVDRAGMRAVGWVLAVAVGSVALRLLLAGEGPIAAALLALAGLVAAVCPIVVPTRRSGRFERFARSDGVVAERRFER